MDQIRSDGRIFAFNNATRARPYIARFSVLSLLIWPSIWPLLHGSCDRVPDRRDILLQRDRELAKAMNPGIMRVIHPPGEACQVPATEDPTERHREGTQGGELRRSQLQFIDLGLLWIAEHPPWRDTQRRRDRQSRRPVSPGPPITPRRWPI
jgi:hypothetical protein